MKKVTLPMLGVIAASVLLTACGGSNVKTDDAMPAKASMNNDDLYEVHDEGRIYVFDDRDVYEDFLSVGETSYRKVRIGDGPRGETVVFGLTNEDKKKMSGIASVEMYDGELNGAEDFYGEMRMEGRIYVFQSLEEMNTARTVGEVPLRFTSIGSGPNGETVVYALNSDNKKKEPTALVEKFKAANGL
ncbi:hypothetical protein DN730_16395 [Marinomonas piezotolerans]|uniref:Lipoprotein n=1 Tax=Marinomonas piezotolerans TaxID=2213058 RepID=A0A370U5P0_9GAMM|nr:hypothetical protein [Marinomonas piezotolerans]RDL43078.1 hypothetical protein DN730_16395 [Marinomonas piezotolerans]